MVVLARPEETKPLLRHSERELGAHELPQHEGQDPSVAEVLNLLNRIETSTRFEAATGPAALSGIAVETDDKTGLAKRVAPVRLGAVLSEARPDFWD